jgi:hypothetical protein
VRDHWGEGERTPIPFADGAAAREDDKAWVLLDEAPVRGLGRALAWADQQDVGELHLLVEAAAGVLARKAVPFVTPPSVWRVEGRAVTPAEPEPPVETRIPEVDIGPLLDLLVEAGVDVVVEHGEVAGEVLGLEIARVVVDDEAGARLEVGVGRHDREAFGIIHGDVPTPDALAQVVDTVRRHRRAGADPHPLNRLAAERWLRARIVEEPQRVGVRSLVAVAPPVPRDNVKDSVPAPAVGEDDHGAPVVVVASTGIDLDLVPAAADARALHAPDARLILAVPERDDHPVTRRLAEALSYPAEVVPIEGDWRAPS